MEIPEAARAKTKAGAEAFGKYYTVEIGRAYETNDVAPLEAMSDPKCSVCAGLIADVKGNRKKGIHADANAYDNILRSSAMRNSDSSYTAAVTIKSVPYSNRKRNGDVVRKFTSTDVTFNHVLKWQRDHWVVAQSVAEVGS